MTSLFSATPARLLSQEGIGGSEIDLIDRSGSPNAVNLSLVSNETAERQVLMRELGADEAQSIALSDQPETVLGSYTGALSGAGALAAGVRTTWPNQASVAYVAEEAARDLVLPMLIVKQGDHSTVFSVLNPSEDETASVNVFVFGPESGELLATFSALIDPGGVSSWDTFFDQAIFGPQNLPPNAADGFVGAVHFESNIPVVGLGYGEEIAKLGSAAYGARPRSAAATTQILPWVREDPGGDSLIAIAVADQGPSSTDVTVSFVPEDGGVGGTEPVDVAFTIGPRGAAYLDLGAHGRGTIELPPSLETFRGSAIVTASRPVLAATLERQHDDERDIIYSVTAYNAFSPDELSAGYEAPTIRRQTDYRSSVLHMLNPNEEAANVEVELRDGDGAPVDTTEHVLEAGAGLWLDVADVEAFGRGTGSASIRADRPVAALVGEQRDASVTYPTKPLFFGIGGERMSGVRGTALLTQIGDDIEVIVELDTESTTTLAIVAGPCSDEEARRLHTLQSSTPRRSKTLVRNVTIEELAETPHAIRGWRRSRRRACGNIPVIYDAKDADASLSRALAARYVPPTAPPEPTATLTPEAPPTDVPTVTPDTPPTVDPGEGEPTIYLPITKHEAG